MKLENNQQYTIETSGDHQIWRNFYYAVISKHGGFGKFMKIARDTRIELINEELKQYHGRISGIGYTSYINFESDEYRTWFILRWS